MKWGLPKKRVLLIIMSKCIGSLLVQQQLNEHGTVVPPHPSYPPDLSPRYLYPFTQRKDQQKVAQDGF